MLRIAKYPSELNLLRKLFSEFNLAFRDTEKYSCYFSNNLAAALRQFRLSNAIIIHKAALYLYDSEPPTLFYYNLA